MTTVVYMEHRTRITPRVTTRVKTAIRKSGLSDNRVSILTGIPRTTFGRLVDGVSPWNTDQLESVAKALEVDPWEFFAAPRKRAS
jgi:lambda repressor-like predicted transcriptional regulator